VSDGILGDGIKYLADALKQNKVRKMTRLSLTFNIFFRFAVEYCKVGSRSS